MNRYFVLPSEPFALHDPATDLPVTAQDKDGKPVPACLTHQGIFRTVTLDPRLKDLLDASDIYALRVKLTGDFGALVELTEEEHKHLMVVLKRPANSQTPGATQVLTEGALVSPGVHELFRRVFDAKSEKPV